MLLCFLLVWSLTVIPSHALYWAKLLGDDVSVSPRTTHTTHWTANMLNFVYLWFKYLVYGGYLLLCNYNILNTITVHIILYLDWPLKKLNVNWMVLSPIILMIWRTRSWICTREPIYQMVLSKLVWYEISSLKALKNWLVCYSPCSHRSI